MNKMIKHFDEDRTNFMSVTLSTTEDRQQERGKKNSNEILAKLQEVAIPVPIRVACTNPPDVKPDYLGVEYHGRLSQDEEISLLEGKCGRFVISDTHKKTSDHEYSIIFNYKCDIFKVRLVYDPFTKLFNTDPPSQKKYKTVLLLMNDVLSYHHNAERNDVSGITERRLTKNSITENSHDFQIHTYFRPKWCDYCNEFLWGVHNQGYRCSDCNTAVHRFCRYKMNMPCNLNLKFGTNMLSVEISGTEQSNAAKLRRGVLPDFHNKCQYFRECSQFLSAYNIRDIYINMSHPSTQCFCRTCMNERLSKSEYSNPPSESYIDWTSHFFANQEDLSKRSVRNWEIAYFPIKPKYLLKMIEECFEPKDDDTDIDLLLSKNFDHTSQDMMKKRHFHKFVDSKTGDYSYAHILLEMYIKPGSYHAVTIANGVIRMIENCDSTKNLLCVKKRKFVYPKSVMIKISRENYATV